MQYRTARSLIAACSVAAAAGSAPSIPAEAQEPDVAVLAAPPSDVARDAFPTGAPLASQAERLLNQLLSDQQTLFGELERLDARTRQVHLRSIARGRAYVRLSRAGLLPAGAGVKSLIEHASRVESLKRAIERDLELERELLDLKVRLLKKKRELDERLSAMQSERALMEQNRVALDAARDRTLAFERAFSSSGADHTAIYGAGVGPLEPSTRVTGFEALKGKLPFPLVGRSEVRPARRRAASGPALELLAAAGSVVRAVYPGSVAFADEYADYGKSIIVDHGNGYFTVSANLASIDVNVGEDVGSGSRLGTLGTGSGALYFEIRRGTDTLDPAAWFGL